MGAEDTHYDVLGVSENASPAEIEAAVAQLAHVASALSLTAPAQADALWLRIRQISRDLLSGEDRRRMYDRALRTQAPRTSSSASSAGPTVMPVAAGSSIGQHAAPAPARVRSPLRRQFRSSIADLGIALAVMAVVAALFLQPWNWHGSHPASPALALSANGPQVGDAYRSGDTVELHWTSSGRGVIYHLQIGRGTSLADRSLAFLPPWRNVLTERPDYRFRVVGAQFYFWRVQTYIGGHWQRWSPASLLAVAAPEIAVPRVRSSGRTVRPGRTRLCWSSVRGAAGYSVRVDGWARAARSRCLAVTLAAGTHHWQVAALVRGSRLYTGAYSPSETIRAVVRRHHTRISHSHSSASSSSTSTGATRGGHQSGSVVVAPPSLVAVVSTSLPSGTSHRTAHRSSTHRTSHSSHSAAGSTRSTKHSTHHAARTSSHRARSTRQRRKGGTSTRVPAPPRLPATHRSGASAGGSPAGTTSIPAPPPPPAAPAAPPPTPQSPSGHVFVAAVTASAPAPTPTASSQAAAGPPATSASAAP